MTRSNESTTPAAAHLCQGKSLPSTFPSCAQQERAVPCTPAELSERLCSRGTMQEDPCCMRGGNILRKCQPYPNPPSSNELVPWRKLEANPWNRVAVRQRCLWRGGCKQLQLLSRIIGVCQASRNWTVNACKHIAALQKSACGGSESGGGGGREEGTQSSRV